MAGLEFYYGPRRPAVPGHIEDVSFFPNIMETAARSYHGCRPASSVCVFCSDSCAPAAEALSNLASEAGASVPVVLDGAVPDWVGPGTDAVLVSFTGDCPGILAARDELRARGCSLHYVTSGGALFRGFARGDDIALVPASMGPSGSLASVLGTLCAMASSMGVLDALPYVGEAASSARARSDEIVAASSELSAFASGGVSAVCGSPEVSACVMRARDAVGTCADGSAHGTVIMGPFPPEGVQGRAISVDLGGGSTLARNVAGMIVADMAAEALTSRERGPDPNRDLHSVRRLPEDVRLPKYNDIDCFNAMAQRPVGGSGLTATAGRASSRTPRRTRTSASRPSPG